MGLLLNTTVLIAGVRRRDSVQDILERVQQQLSDDVIGISAISVVELTHGIYRGQSLADKERRQLFVEDVFHDLLVYPVTLEIGKLAGQIEGEQAAKGVVIPFEDLVIGATALWLGFSVGTQNIKHFNLIPDLTVVTL